jgi:two-component system, NtrC family, response regulator AtoC
MAFTTLIVDDEPEFCRTLEKILTVSGFPSRSTNDPLAVGKLISEQMPEALILDVRMPKLGGLKLLEQLRSKGIRVPVLMVSGYDSPEAIVQAMKIGATNFFVKPLKIPELLQEIETLASRAQRHPFTHSRVIETRAPAMEKVIAILRKVAPTDVPVVLTGESGTGKELAAAALHEMSARARGPFIKLNCAAIPETLLESELFGHEKGAYTDAHATRIGKFEEAQGGTIFLDEIGEMSPKTQAKLLRVLQERVFERVGSNQVRPLDVRFLAATNRDFDTMIREGSFREDLYYRLSVVKVDIPPLRERRVDIVDLAESFREEFCEIYHRKVLSFSEEVYRIFLAHQWPGNVRELRNCVERAVIFCDGPTIEAQDLPMHYDEVRRINTREYHELLDHVNREKILEALDKAGGNKTAAADLLSMPRRTFYNKMKVLGIPL